MYQFVEQHCYWQISIQSAVTILRLSLASCLAREWPVFSKRVLRSSTLHWNALAYCQKQGGFHNWPCSGHRMLLERERNSGWGMDAVVTACSYNRNGIMVWACMLWSPSALGTRTEFCFGHGCSGHPPYALGTRTELWLGHGCSGHPMLLEHERKPNKRHPEKRAFRWTETSPDGIHALSSKPVTTMQPYLANV